MIKLRSIFKYFIFVLLTSLLTACGGEQPVAVEERSVIEEHIWTDSIFGEIGEKERYYQHLLLEVPAAYQLQLDSLGDWLIQNNPGALYLKDWNTDSIQILKYRLDTHEIIQPVFYTNYFDFLQLKPYPYWESNKANRSVELARVFKKLRCGILDLDANYAWTKNFAAWNDTLQRRFGLVTVSRKYEDRNIRRDFSQFFSELNYVKGGIELQLSQYDTVKLEEVRKTGNYQGLFIASCRKEAVNLQIAEGADLVRVSIEDKIDFESWAGSENPAFEESTKRILRLKERLGNQKLVPQNIKRELKFVRSNLSNNGVASLSNKKKLLPFTKRFSIYSEEKIQIHPKIKKEDMILTYTKKLTPKVIRNLTKGKDHKLIVLPDSLNAESLKILEQMPEDNNTAICFSNPDYYNRLKNIPTLIFSPESTPDFNLLSQQLTARLDMNGSAWIGDSLINGELLEKKKLARVSPEFTCLDPDTLNRIDWVIKTAMNGRAFPGCQVLLAKNGCIVYDKSFGHHSYEREKLVTEESIYDLASVTKVIATTMVGMKLYEMKSFALEDSLKDYLPDSLKFYLRFPSTIRDITFQELFIHKSGLPAGFPIIDYMQYTNDQIGRFDRYYCDKRDSLFCVEVGDGFYMDKDYQDTLWIRLNRIWLDPNKPYKYSDVSMNTLYFMFKSIIEKDKAKHGFNKAEKDYKNKNLFEEFLYTNYYRPLGMERTRYRPLRSYDTLSIVPTEDESWWRKQLLRGFVHDPNAALHGGVAGNAGMFSTTNDLVILLQMLLNKGEYNGKRYLNAETVSKFTARQPDSHRGLGWNKPTITSTGYGIADSASLATYGHTGFTGTCIWVDPRSELIYVFLSNRVHPKVNNRIYQHGVRKRIHEAAYAAMMNGSGVRN